MSINEMGNAVNTVIFDLDGTITDPADGITRSINHALLELGHPAYPEADLHKYIGPHLNITFSELMGTSDEGTLARAIELYWERYIPVGYRENRLYDGMKKVLSQLGAEGHALCIATTKRKDIAQSVLDFLQINTLFTQVHGCDFHRTKPDLLRDILSDDTLSSQPMVMIGDRDTDFDAATEVGMPSIAVRWGYGTDDELSMATAVAGVPEDLPQVIEKIAQQSTRVVGREGFIGKHQKLHLPPLEAPLFSRGKDIKVFDLQGVKIGIGLCFDTWFPELCRELMLKQCQILCHPANFGADWSLNVIRTRALENMFFTITANRNGEHFRGESVIYDKMGTVLTQVAKEDVVKSVEIDPKEALGKKSVICADLYQEVELYK